MEYEITGRKDVYKGHAFDVQEIHFTLPDSRQRTYDLVNHADSVTIIPIDADGKFYFVEQFRTGSESIMIELPAGVMDGKETPAECAAREVREEIGMAAGKLTHIASIYLAAGYSNELNHIFLGEDLVYDPLPQDEDEFLTTVKLTIQELDHLIRSGKMQDSKSLAALYLYHQKYP